VVINDLLRAMVKEKAVECTNSLNALHRMILQHLLLLMTSLNLRQTKTTKSILSFKMHMPLLKICSKL